MKILIDENIDVRFKNLFLNSSHEVYTVRDMQWNGIKNGTLLGLLKEHGFNCWIVVDKNIPYQQNISKLPCTVIVLDVFRNTLEHITPLFPALLAAIEGITENNVIVITKPKEK
jgi:hypothetical protein